jgi:hypothetical protein
MPEASEASKTTEPEFSFSVANFPLLHKNLRRAQITVEFHDFLPYFDHAQDIILIKSRLKRLGFTCVKYSMSCHADVLFINRQTAGISAMEIAYLNWIDRHVRALKRGLIRVLKR